MFGSIIACLLLVTMIIKQEPLYAIAAGLFELAGVLWTLMRPLRLKTKEVPKNDTN